VNALIAALTAAVCLLGLLVAGLLRSHADILRRLHRLGTGDEPRSEPRSWAGTGFRIESGLVEPRDDFPPASDLAGVAPAGDEAIAVGVVDTPGDTLIAFLSSGCLTCAPFWDTAAGAELGDGTRLVVVTKGPEDESRSAVAEKAAADGAAGVTVLMSSEAWEAYGVPGSPYFVLVHGPEGVVGGEGSASSWAQVTDLMATARADLAVDRWGGEAPADVVDVTTVTGRGEQDRPGRVDRELAAAGIVPGHPSLYPDAEERRDGDDA
jgi:hypothetical protein